MTKQMTETGAKVLEEARNLGTPVFVQKIRKPAYKGDSYKPFPIMEVDGDNLKKAINSAGKAYTTMAMKWYEGERLEQLSKEVDNVVYMVKYLPRKNTPSDQIDMYSITDSYMSDILKKFKVVTHIQYMDVNGNRSTVYKVIMQDYWTYDIKEISGELADVASKVEPFEMDNGAFLLIGTVPMDEVGDDELGFKEGVNKNGIIEFIEDDYIDKGRLPIAIQVVKLDIIGDVYRIEHFHDLPAGEYILVKDDNSVRNYKSEVYSNIRTTIERFGDIIVNVVHADCE